MEIATVHKIGGVRCLPAGNAGSSATVLSEVASDRAWQALSDVTEAHAAQLDATEETTDEE
ncbi:hypothetical protein GCM10027174_45090 [Salinifilum aidingensis]